VATLLEEALEVSRCVVSITPLDITASGPSFRPFSTSMSASLRSLVFPGSEGFVESLSPSSFVSSYDPTVEILSPTRQSQAPLPWGRTRKRSGVRSMAGLGDVENVYSTGGSTFSRVHKVPYRCC
jgi:hypothetical protein